MHTGLSFWIGFHVAVLLLLALDLFVFSRGERKVSMREAAIASVAWVLLSLGFGAWIHFVEGPVKAGEFITGYVIEYSLSMDNLFVFVMIFAFFNVDPRYQHRVLLWGIIGTLVLRGAMVGIGVELVQKFAWVMYVFGVFLLGTGVRMFFTSGQEDPGGNLVIRLCRKIPRVTTEFHGSRFLVRTAAGWMLTPLALVLVVLTVMDLVFAVDSVPAVLAVSRDPFIVYTSNICAILGLRSLYFLLAGVAYRFQYVQYGLAAVLCFIGIKMLLADMVHISNGVSLAVVAGLLAVSILWSMVRRDKAE